MKKYSKYKNISLANLSSLNLNENNAEQQK